MTQGGTNKRRTVDDLLDAARARLARLLEWRADPACAACDPRIARLDAVLVIVCQQGYQSSLAASNLHDLGLTGATDLEGGFEAWRAAGLPIDDS